MDAPELYCLIFSAEPASGLGQSSTADQPWMAHIYIRWDVLSHELQNGPCRKTFELEHLETFIKVGLGISRTNADSQWNPVYNAFHRIFCCGNETIRRQYCKRDLDTANMRPALEQGCGKQTPSAGKLFFRANLLYVPIIKMQGDQDLGLYTTSGLAFGEPQRNDKF